MLGRLIDKFKKGLTKTREGMVQKIREVIRLRPKLDEEALEEIFFLPEVLAALTFFLVPADLEADVFLLGFAIVFFLEAVFVFSGFLVDVLRTDFFEAINNPFYFNETAIFPILNRTEENDSLSQVSQQGTRAPLHAVSEYFCGKLNQGGIKWDS